MTVEHVLRDTRARERKTYISCLKDGENIAEYAQIGNFCTSQQSSTFSNNMD